MEFVHNRNFNHAEVTIPKSKKKSQFNVRFTSYVYAMEPE